MQVGALQKEIAELETKMREADRLLKVGTSTGLYIILL